MKKLRHSRLFAGNSRQGYVFMLCYFPGDRHCAEYHPNSFEMLMGVFGEWALDFSVVRLLKLFLVLTAFMI